MMENTRIYTVDKYWRQIFTDLGMIVVDSPTVAAVVFDDYLDFYRQKAM